MAPSMLAARKLQGKEKKKRKKKRGVLAPKENERELLNVVLPFWKRSYHCWSESERLLLKLMQTLLFFFFRALP